MKIAITGGTGFVGRHTQAELVLRGHEVVSCSRRTGVGVDDVDALANAFAGCQAVVHCAGINRELGEQTYARVHVGGTAAVVEAARRAGVRKLVMMSFLRARPDCGSGYHESKWRAEEIVRGSGLDHVVIKAGMIHGQGDHMLDHLSHALHTVPVFGLIGLRPTPIRPIAVDDMASLLATAAESGRLDGRTVAVVGPETLTLREAVGRVAREVGRRPVFVRLPVVAHRALAWGFERVMRVPLISAAQVRILSEGVVEPAGRVDALPSDLAPTTRFDAASIRRGLPPRGAFSLRDLRCCCLAS